MQTRGVERVHLRALCMIKCVFRCPSRRSLIWGWLFLEQYIEWRSTATCRCLWVSPMTGEQNTAGSSAFTCVTYACKVSSLVSNSPVLIWGWFFLEQQGRDQRQQALLVALTPALRGVNKDCTLCDLKTCDAIVIGGGSGSGAGQVLRCRFREGCRWRGGGRGAARDGDQPVKPHFSVLGDAQGCRVSTTPTTTVDVVDVEVSALRCCLSFHWVQCKTV